MSEETISPSMLSFSPLSSVRDSGGSSWCLGPTYQQLSGGVCLWRFATTISTRDIFNLNVHLQMCPTDHVVLSEFTNVHNLPHLSPTHLPRLEMLSSLPSWRAPGWRSRTRFRGIQTLDPSCPLQSSYLVQPAISADRGMEKRGRQWLWLTSRTATSVLVTDRDTEGTASSLSQLKLCPKCLSEKTWTNFPLLSSSIELEVWFASNEPFSGEKSPQKPGSKSHVHETLEKTVGSALFGAETFATDPWRVNRLGESAETHVQ